jgi:hypothetical protein
MSDAIRRLKELETENSRLQKAVSDLSLDKLMRRACSSTSVSICMSPDDDCTL